MVSLVKLIGHDAHSMFRIVADTNLYASFIPFCTISTKVPLSSTSFLSTLTLTPPISLSYTSTVTLHRNTIIAQASNQSIFSSLTTTWQFTSLYPSRPKPTAIKTHLLKPLPRILESGQQGLSEIKVDIVYELVNPLYAPLASILVPRLTQTYVQAFQKRAEELHGAPITPEMILRKGGLTLSERIRMLEYDKIYKAQEKG